jgi:hypothetical protein
VNPIAAQIQFIRARGTPKLKACDDATLARYLGRADLVRVWVPGAALGLGWFTTAGALYVANLMAATPAGLLALLDEFRDRFPWVTRFEGHRVPALLRRQRPDLTGLLRHYAREHLFSRFHRFAAHRARRAEDATRLRQADLPEAGNVSALPTPLRRVGPARVEPSAGGMGVLELLSPLTARTRNPPIFTATARAICIR